MTIAERSTTADLAPVDWRPTPAALVVALAVAVAFIVHARGWTFLCDDAFISFRYARNWAEHGAPVFNVYVDPPEHVEGYTNFLWVAMLAGLARLGVVPHEAAPILTQLAGLLTLAAVTMLVAVLRRHCTKGQPERRLVAIDLLPAALLVCVPEFMVWTHGGLETSAAGATALGAMATWVAGRQRTAAILAAATGLLRPDGLLPVAVFGLTWLLVFGLPVVWRERAQAFRRLPWLRLLQAAMLFVVPLLVHLMWRRSYYGEWLPNTWAIKAHGALLRDTYGIAYVEAWWSAFPLVYLLPLVLLLRPRHLLALLPIGIVVAYGYSVGGDFMAYSRFYIVATLLLGAVVGWLLADLATFLRRFVSAAIASAIALVITAGLCAGLAHQNHARWEADMAKPTGWIDGKWEGVAAMDRFARVGRAAGEWMHENLPRETLISVGAAGAVPYGARVPVVDSFGLVDPVIARLPNVRPYTGPGARPGHQLNAPHSYMKKRDPDLLCHVGYRGARKPSERHARPAFRRGYTWACIDAPPVADPRAEGGMLDVGFYCCRRPIDRVVGPFGREGR